MTPKFPRKRLLGLICEGAFDRADFVKLLQGEEAPPRKLVSKAMNEVFAKVMEDMYEQSIVGRMFKF